MTCSSPRNKKEQPTLIRRRNLHPKGNFQIIILYLLVWKVLLTRNMKYNKHRHVSSRSKRTQTKSTRLSGRRSSISSISPFSILLRKTRWSSNITRISRMASACTTNNRLIIKKIRRPEIMLETSLPAILTLAAHLKTKMVLNYNLKI